MNNNRKNYSKEYKVQAVKLTDESDKSITAVAKSLGIIPTMLCRWVKEYEEFGEEAFSGNGRRKNFELENRKLKRKVEELEIENEILKKFQGFLKAQKD